MLIDHVTIRVQGGRGGDGAISFRRNEGNPRGGPDGGNGGDGGDIYLVGVDDFTALSQFQYKKTWKADDGGSGKRKNLFGKNADDLYIKVPLGTRVRDEAGRELFEVTRLDTPYLLVRGGKGGRGNNEFKSAINQAPKIAEKGKAGETKVVTLELRLLAQIGLIGLPNAGKSTLLSVLTNATPKIADYPFTTVEPNIGMMDHLMIADIPGLIKGASQGRGLGVTFLKHIEKTYLLLHCIDASDENPFMSYQTVRDEFNNYNPQLLSKPEIILLTKADQVSNDDLKRKMTMLSKTNREVISISAFDEESIHKLYTKLLSFEYQLA